MKWKETVQKEKGTKMEERKKKKMQVCYIICISYSLKRKVCANIDGEIFMSMSYTE